MSDAKNRLALSLLRAQLGEADREEILPAAVSLAIGQSPVLVSGQEAVLRLRGTEEPDDNSREEDVPPPDAPPQPEAPLPEEPAQPDTPLVFADNGVEARTLIPSSPEGYVVSNGVYISNRTDYPLDASLFDGSFAAALPEEEGPQILIVHTHGSEAYTMPPGQEYEPSGESRTTDTSLNVVRVGDELAKTLEEAGLTVLHDPTLHDYPEYSGAYGRSLDAVNAYLAEYPTISFVLDVHRDAISDAEGTPYKVVSGVAGLNAAQMSFVIGTDGGGLLQGAAPFWGLLRQGSVFQVTGPGGSAPRMVSARAFPRRRAESRASSRELPAAPISTSRDPGVVCWLYRELRTVMGRMRVG